MWYPKFHYGLTFIEIAVFDFWGYSTYTRAKRKTVNFEKNVSEIQHLKHMQYTTQANVPHVIFT